MNNFFTLIKNNKGFLIFVAFLFIFRGAIADWHPVPTGSMKPTILEGDVVWENKLAYDLQIPFTDISLMRLDEPERGDIVVFTSAAADKRMIKRLIGLPNDIIEVKNNQLIINGKTSQYSDTDNPNIIPERNYDKEDGRYDLEVRNDKKTHPVQRKYMFSNYPPGLSDPRCVHDISIPVKVPDDHYFVLGDNRDSSADSRCYGFIPRSEIRGHATHTIMSVITQKTWNITKWRFRVERFLNLLD